MVSDMGRNTKGQKYEGTSTGKKSRRPLPKAINSCQEMGEAPFLHLGAMADGFSVGVQGHVSATSQEEFVI